MNITKDEAESLADFIKCNLIKDIRDDEYIDSIEWVVNMVHVYEKGKGSNDGGQRMTPKEAHRYVEDLQRMLTRYRFHFSEKFIEANGMAIVALEKQEKYAWHDLRKNPEDLPDELTNVNVSWINHNPSSYYDFIKDKITSGDSAIFYRGKWWWYSCVCVDLLVEYGFSRGDEVDKDIEIIAWRYIEPFEEDNE